MRCRAFCRIWSGPVLLAAACLVLAASAVNLTALGQTALPELDPEAARQKQIVERFVLVLEKNPRRGTALDRIYGHHIENGTIEAFVQSLRDRVAAKPDDGAGWMILGLMESQRGRDAAAVEALTKAKEQRPADPLAAYYLGQSLVLVGQPERAAEAFEEAIQRKPGQVDLLEIFQALGRVHQRAQRTEQALAVWSRLEKLFPSDPRVQEQIAITLVEEGQPAEALPRYEALAKSTTDDYRRTVYQMDAAELKIKLSRSNEGIADLERLLEKLNPESWLFREVRRKIEEVFLRTDDQDGLAKYYTAWLGKNPEDIEAMARLARVLARQARVPEAQEWLDKALKLAPSRKELRLAFIEQLVDDQRYSEAIQQYVALDKADPNNPDHLRDWGKLVLRDTAQPKEQRQTEAEKIWRKLLAARPSDPLIATQVADLFRHAELQPQALELYQKAVELAPAQPQYREYLGEYFHILKRPDEAQATWRKIAEGNQRTATNVARLAEVLAQFGYIEQALPEIAAACQLDPKDFSLHLKAADMQIRGEAFEAALASLAVADQLAQNDEERDAVLAQQIKTYTLQDKLTGLANGLAAETKNGTPGHGQWFLLARYREALHEYPEATHAIQEALKLQPSDIRSLAAAARIAEQSGELLPAADLNRKLAVVDRRSRAEYLEHVARLETQLGRTEEALAAGRDLIAAAPGNVETYQYFADLCFRLGKIEDGLTALRRATRVNPNEPAPLLALAAALANQFRTDEAIELYWQAFEKQPLLDDKLGVIGKLAELYLQTNHLDQLLERLQRGQREADQRREMTICLAQAYQSAGDYGMARQELERLLNENTRDTQLLLQLSKLAESESDIGSAVKYQDQLAKIAPGAEVEYRLATLLSRAGDNQQAADILVRLAVKEDDKEKLLRNIDGLLAAEQYDTALAVLEPKLRENATDWELLYREGFALAKRRPADAPPRFETILELSTGDDELGIAAKNRQAKQRTQPVTSVSAATAAAGARPRPLRTDYAYEVRRAIGLDQEPLYIGTTMRRPVWMPQDFGQARLAAIGWLFSIAQKENRVDAFITGRKGKAEATSATPRALWDWVHLQAIRADEDALLPATRKLAEKGGPSEKLLYLMKLAQRGGEQNVNSARATPDKDDKTPPLEAEELEFVLRLYHDIRKLPADPQSATGIYGRSATVAVLKELARAGRKEEEQRLYREAIDRATTTEELSAALQIAQQRRDHAAFAAVFDRLSIKDLQKVESRMAAPSQVAQAAAQSASQHMGQPDTQPAEVLQTLDRYLTYHAAKVNQRRSSPTYRPGSRSLTMRQSNYVYVWSGNSQRYVQLPYPAPGEYFDQQSLGVLRGAFEVYRSKDLTSDLVKHLETFLTQALPADKLFAALALAYVQVWNDDRESAVSTLAQAASFNPQDLDLRLEAARLNLEMGQFDEALAIVDGVAPLDQRTMQQRETLALDLAVRLGDHQRAREAAQRLFGLRLDAETQVTLAGQMRRLGMNEESEAVLARAQRQAGSRIAALSALMVQYQAQGQMETAAQVAHQILRRSRTASASQTAMGYSTADSQARTSALRCLAQAGKLKELIAGLEQQIERTPQASQLYETLSEYYQAAGDAQKQLDLQAKIIALRPDDADLRYRYGQELYRRGKVKEACDEYLIVIKKQPQLLRNRYYEVVQAFQRAKREAELARVLGEIDLRSFGQSYIVSNLLSYLMRDGDSRTVAMALFKKAWEVFPDQRANLMNNFYDPALWKLPEVLEYGKQSLLPNAAAIRDDPWYGIYSALSFEGDGRVNAVLHRVLDAANSTNQLGKLREEIAAAADEHPRWRAGAVLLALIDLRMGKDVDAPAAVQPLLDATSVNDYQLRYARWIIGQELEAKPATKDLALQLYEKAANANDEDLNDDFQYGPAQRLVHIYRDAGRQEDARQLLLKAARRQPVQDNNYPYRLSQKAQTIIAIGKMLLDMDHPVDALTVYRELLVNADFNDPQISMYSGQNPEQFKGQARQGIQAALKKLGARPSADHLQAFLSAGPKPGKAAAAGALDLMIAAAPLENSAMPVLDSPLLAIIRPAGMSAEAQKQIEARLVALEKEHPSDLSVQIAAAMFALKGGPAAKIDGALVRLKQVVEATPLDELAAGKRANARQRTEALPHIGLWLIARECLADSARRELAESFAGRAIAAAQRQLEPAELTAILYERGKLALDAGDRAAAEKYWNELIDLALVEPRKPRTSISRTQPSAAPPIAAAPSVARSSPPPSAVRPPAIAVAPAAVANAGTNSALPRATQIPATLSQFKLGAALSEAAAGHGLVALSLRAIRESLSGGVPVADLPKAAGMGMPTIRPSPYGPATSRSDIDETVFTELSSRLWKLSIEWKQHDFPAADVCQLLEEIVFPAARPGDVLLYEQPLTNDISNPQSVGRLLVEWAVRALRTAEIEKQVAARQASPTDVVGGQVLRAQLAVAQGEPEKAKEQMRAIVEQLETSKLNALTGLATHAAAAAYGNEQLMLAAAPLLERIIASPAPLGRSISYAAPNPHSPATLLVRQYVRAGNSAAAQMQIDQFFLARQPLYARFGGEGGLHQQRLDWLWAANELSRGGDPAITLGALGRGVDITLTRNYFNAGNATTIVALWHLARQARRLPAAERYQLLRDWTLPTDDRRSVRVVAGPDSGQPIPSIFLEANGSDSERQTLERPGPPLSNLTLLVESASECGQLEELSKSVEDLAKEKVEGSDALALLVLIARRDDAAAIPRLEEMTKRAKEAARPQTPQPNRPAEPRRPLAWEDCLVAHAALSVPELTAPARRLAKQLMAQGRATGQQAMVYQLGYDLAQHSLAGLPLADRELLANSPLALWTAGGTNTMVDAVPPIFWAAAEGHLAGRSASGSGSLLFRVPLTGDFDFSFAGLASNESHCAFGYGGISLMLPGYANGPLAISAAGGSDTIHRPAPVLAADGWNRLKVRVSPTSVRFYVNDRLAYEDLAPGADSPWLSVGGHGAALAMKNFRMSGSPTIPRELPLLAADQLDGWNASTYGEQLPKRLQKAEPPPETDELNQPRYVVNAYGEYVMVDPNASFALDWEAADGVLSGRVDRSAGPQAQSRLFYHRPLAAGDRIAYQFLYEPGQTHVHPTFSSIAYLFDPDGLKLHWMTRTNDAADPLLVDPRNAVVDSAGRRGGPILPLKENEWNDVELALRGNVLHIALNGQAICERTLETADDRCFGFFHFTSETAVKIRNLVLRGDWPQSLTAAEQSDLLKPAGEASPALARAHQALVGEQTLTSAAYEVWSQAQDMVPADRFVYLKNWVLPSDSRPSLRLQVDWLPIDSPLPQHSPYENLISPARELVTVAKDLNKLDELATAAALAAKKHPDLARQVASFQVLIALARGDGQAAAPGLAQALEFVKSQSAETPVHERHGELLAVYAALGAPTTRKAALALAEQIVNDQKSPRNVNGDWERRVRRLRAMAQWANGPQTADLPFGEAGRFSQWLPASPAIARDLALGFGPAAWQLTPGAASFFTGSNRDALYYYQPLTGDFEIRCQRTTYGWQEIRLLYAGFSIDVKSDGITIERQDVGRSQMTTAQLPAKLKKWGQTVDYRLTIKDGELTAYMNDEKVHSERLPAQRDPWLAIESRNGYSAGSIKNLQIIGTPTVPTEINLTAGLLLDGWHANFYGERVAQADRNTGQAAEWMRKGNEITASRLPKSAGSFRESVLQYHRPLLEDGEVEYEFYFEPGKTEVHPALGRRAFLLAPEGAKLHQLTAAQHERTGLTPETAELLPLSKPLQLRERDWNKLKLTLAGDEVTIAVNGAEVARHDLAAAADRTFGLFRYADASEVRVRNVVYRGKWPSGAPPLSEQELAHQDGRKVQ